MDVVRWQNAAATPRKKPDKAERGRRMSVCIINGFLCLKFHGFFVLFLFNYIFVFFFYLVNRNMTSPNI